MVKAQDIFSRLWKRRKGTWEDNMCAKLGDERQSEVAVNFFFGREGRANECWTVTPGVIRDICTDFHAPLFNAVVKD